MVSQPWVLARGAERAEATKQCWGKSGCSCNGLLALLLVLVAVGCRRCLSAVRWREEGDQLVFEQPTKIPFPPEICLYV